MDQLIQTIHHMTIELNQLLQDDHFEEFEKLLSQRKLIMDRVDTLRSYDPSYQYGEEETKLLWDTFQLDQQIGDHLRTRLDQTQQSLNQLQKNKEVKKKYSPYLKQTSGIFFDRKK